MILISTLVDYFCSLAIQSQNNNRHKKLFLAISICVNITILGIFKYYDFFAESFSVLAGHVGLTVHPYILNLVLPVGISFYTFQTMSYTVDVYRGKLAPEEKIVNFALFVSFFPQLLAGPIERAGRLIPQLAKPKVVNWGKVSRGAYLFFWGLFLKVFIADNLARIVDPVYGNSGPFDGGEVLIATYAFSFQVYCDFAGYSTMATGLAFMMGISLMENFKRPYFATNISDFWRRWHISLSSWFRDYVYTPLYVFTQKRRAIAKLNFKVRHWIAFLITIVTTEYLVGQWHGANWTFAVFGLYHGILIALYYGLRKQWDSMNKFVQIFLTFHLVCLGLVIFRSPNLEQAYNMLYGIFFNFNLDQNDKLVQNAISGLGFVSILFIVQIFQERRNDALVVLQLPFLFRYTFIVFLFCLITIFGDFGNRPFVYFQF